MKKIRVCVTRLVFQKANVIIEIPDDLVYGKYDPDLEEGGEEAITAAVDALDQDAISWTSLPNEYLEWCEYEIEAEGKPL